MRVAHAHWRSTWCFKNWYDRWTLTQAKPHAVKSNSIGLWYMRSDVCFFYNVYFVHSGGYTNCHRLDAPTPTKLLLSLSACIPHERGINLCETIAEWLAIGVGSSTLVYGRVISILLEPKYKISPHRCWLYRLENGYNETMTAIKLRLLVWLDRTWRRRYTATSMGMMVIRHVMMLVYKIC